MIVEYNYDEGMKVLDLLKKSELATLEVQKGETDGFVMEYTTISEYDKATQCGIRKTLSNALPKRVRLMNLFNQFIEKEALGEVDVFSVSMNANRDTLKCTISSSFGGHPITPASSVETLQDSLEKFTVALTNMGSTDLLTPAYKREGSGRNRKYVQLTLGDLVDIIRTAMNSEG